MQFCADRIGGRCCYGEMGVSDDSIVQPRQIYGSSATIPFRVSHVLSLVLTGGEGLVLALSGCVYSVHSRTG